MTKIISSKDTIVIGLMLFALFFGAGNLVFPVMLGQTAGVEFWSANLGFLTTGVGLPLLCVIAFSVSGKQDLLSLTNEVHPIFGLIFTTVLYLTIGPMFAMPRTGSVSYEMGIKPFLSDTSGSWPLMVFSILFFGVTCILSLNPSKMIDIVGKWLTPMLLIFIAILSVYSFIAPLGSPLSAQGDYQTHAYFNGFQEGYLTMDALAAFVFGIIVINAIKERGATSRKSILTAGLKSSLISAVILAIIYSVLTYMGATSVEKFGYLDNGGQALVLISKHYFGTFGGVILGIIVLLACLTTSIGLTTACSSYFHKLLPRISHRVFAVILSIVSALLANVGLAELIQFSVPVLTAIYPLAIVLMILTFAHPFIKGMKPVYWFSLALTFLISIVEGLSASSLNVSTLSNFYNKYVPLYNIGLGWLLPALIGAVIGLIISLILKMSARRKEQLQ